MDHQEVIKRVERIVPEIQQTRDPQGALLKLARSENLSPAQLERVAQMFNAAKTLTYYDKAAGTRGNTFTVVDTEELLDAYTAHAATAPDTKDTTLGGWIDKAAMQKAASAELDPDDINAWIGQPSAKEASDRFPMAFVPELGELEQEVDIDLLTRDYLRGRERIKEASRVTRELIREIRDLQEDEIRAKVASLIDNPSVRWELLEEDVETLAPQNKEAFELVVTHLKAAGYLVDRYDPSTAAPVRMLRDRTGMLQDIQAVQQSLDAVKCAVVLDQEEETAQEDTIAKWQQEFDQEHAGRPRRGGGPAGGGRPVRYDQETGEQIEGDRGGQETGEGRGNQDDYHIQTGDSKTNKGKKDDKKEESSVDRMFAGIESGAKFKGPKQMPTPWKDLLGISATSLLNPGKNVKQEHIDEQLGDDNSVMMLQRFMMSDPIISEADPDMVVELYNTIRKINPEFATDPNRMRLVLRDAIQYESLPIHTISDLAGLRGEEAKGEAAAAKNRSSAYSTGKSDSKSKDKEDA
jgi:hypothetical protein